MFTCLNLSVFALKNTPTHTTFINVVMHRASGSLNGVFTAEMIRKDLISLALSSN